YSHLGGKILTLVELNTPNETDLARDIAMHVAAGVPQVAEFVSPTDVPEEVLIKEREIARSQIMNKPANIIEKIVDGKVNAFCDQICLIRQKFIKDESMTIMELLAKKGSPEGKTIHVVRFLRWQIGV